MSEREGGRDNKRCFTNEIKATRCPYRFLFALPFTILLKVKKSKRRRQGIDNNRKNDMTWLRDLNVVTNVKICKGPPDTVLNQGPMLAAECVHF